MSGATLSELWVRVIETFVSGVAFAGLCVVCGLLASRRGTGLRYTLILLSCCFAAMSLGSFTTSDALYTGKHALAVAWVQGPSTGAKLLLLIYAVGDFPQWAFMLQTWGGIHRKTRGRLLDLEIVNVHVRQPRWMRRLRRSGDDGAT